MPSLENWGGGLKSYRTYYPVIHTALFLWAGEFLQEHRRVLNSRLQPIMMEVLDARARSRDELESTLSY